jgi:GxxExxY protein
MITMIKDKTYTDDLLTKKIIGACFEVHQKLGPGFVEKIYLNALKQTLMKAEVKFNAEREFDVALDGTIVGKFRADLVVEDNVILELKSVEGRLPRIFESQVLSYLKASGLKVGLLINFGNLKCSVRRLVIS